MIGFGLRMPDLGNQLCQANIVRVELIYTDQHANGCCAQSPGHNGAQDREFALVHIIHQHGIKPNMTMYHEGDSEKTVDYREVCPAGDVRSRGKGNQTGRKEPLKGPVVGTMSTRGWGEVGRVVYGALVDRTAGNICSIARVSCKNCRARY